jgi:predicted Zn-dependent protease
MRGLHHQNSFIGSSRQRELIVGSILLLLGGVLTGCTSVEIGGIDVVEMAQAARQVAKGFENISPEEEYYLGRAVAATIAGRYTPYTEPNANHYINVLGQALAKVSDQPETYGGYHFQILDSDEINAFAAPGGFIFVTRGILRCARREAAVAAVLAHEIGHVQHKHGLQAIKKSRLSSAFTAIGLEVIEARSSGKVATLAGIFENSIEDVTTTLVNNGYSRAFERQADRAAVTILQRLGYDPHGLIDMLHVMADRLDPEGADFAKTHPSPEKRIADLEKIVDKDQTAAVSSASRQARFEAALGNI